MRILDRYIAKRFLTTLSFALIAFILIFLIVDLIENLDKFIDKGAPVKVVMMYYLNYVPFIVVLTLPVAMLLSTLFSLGLLARNFELTAMKANGISLYRIIAPVLLIGMMMSIMVFFIGDKLVSASNRRKSDIKSEHIDHRSQATKALSIDLFVEGSNGVIYYMKNYDPNLKIGTGILIHRIENDRVVETIEAKRIKYIGNIWIGEDGTRRVFSSDSISVPNTFEIFGKIPLTEFNEPPEAFEKLKEKPSDMPYSELKKYIELKKRLGKDTAREGVELNLKISFPLMNFIIVMLGAPLAANPRRSGAALGFATSLIFGFIYFTIIRACQSLGQNHDLSPVLAAWLGNMIFFAVGIVLMIKAHK